MTNPNTIALIDKALTLCSPPTAYQLSKLTGISEATLSRCRRRGGTLDDANAARLARFLDIPVLDVVAYMNEDRAKTPEQKALWERMLPRVVPSLVIAILAAGTVTRIAEGSTDVRASRYFDTSRLALLDSLYIMRSMRRRLKRVWREVRLSDRYAILRSFVGWDQRRPLVGNALGPVADFA